MRPLAYPRYKYAASSFVVICDGNSLTAGVGASSAATYWPTQAVALAPITGFGVTPINVAVAGQGIATVGSGGAATTMAGRAAVEVDARLVAGKHNILTAWDYTNEVKYLSGDGVQAHANMMAYCLARRAAAAGKTLRIIVVTTIPAIYAAQTQPTINTWNAGLATANELTRQNYRQYADVLADLAGNITFATLFANGVYTASPFIATGLYSSDNVHLNDAGYAVVAQIMANAMKRVRR
jgi:lysophospholipase L1-like esterase